MKSLQEQLIARGLIGKREAAEAIAQAQLDAEERERRQRMRHSRYATVEDLDTCTTSEAFKQIAKDVLTRDPTQIGSILKKAHAFSGDAEEKRKLITLCFQIRALIGRVSAEKRDTFLNRAFRKRNPVVAIPE